MALIRMWGAHKEEQRVCGDVVELYSIKNDGGWDRVEMAEKHINQN